MIRQLILILSLNLPIFSGQATRYREKIFTEVRITSDIQYGSNIDYQNNAIDLYLDVYEPVDDTETNRPCLVLAHGGAFVTGNKLDPTTVALCKEFALRGYVTVSMQHRLGTGLTYKGFAEAILRAVQDAKAAVRFLHKNRDTFGIDTAKFAVGGLSSGAVTAIHYAFMDNDEIPSEVDTTILGNCEGNSGTPGVSSNISCIVNCWGAIGDTTFIQQDEQVPIISFHGTEDKIVPYDVGFAFEMPFLPLCGSAAIDRQCKRLGITSLLHPYVGMGHGHGVDARFDTTVALTSTFLYENLITATPVVRAATRTAGFRNTPQYTIVQTHIGTTNNRLLPPGTTGIMFGLDGRLLGTVTLNGNGNASGLYVIKRNVINE